MSVFAKKRQSFEPVSMARKNLAWLTVAVWLALTGSVLAFGLGRDFERPKAFCLSLAAAMLMPRAVLIWPTLPGRLRAAVLIWLLVLAASVIFALDPARALIGSFERSQGAYLLLCCTVLALARVPVAILVAPVIFTASVSGVWALVQFFGVEGAIFSALNVLKAGVSEVGWHRAFGWRAFASFGNPMALGSWLVIALVFLFSARVQALQSNRRVLIVRMLDVAIFFGTCGVLLSGTRAAWIALSVVVALQFRHIKLFRIIGLVGLAALVLVLLSFRADSVRARLELVDAALRPAKIALVDALGRSDPYPHARFWLGSGPDLHVVMLEHNLPNRAVGEMPDRAHQMLLDGYLSIGLLGVLSWLGLMSTVWRNRIGSKNVGVFALLAALITWQFGFALSAEKVLCALLMGSMYAPELQIEAAAVAKSKSGNLFWINSIALLFALFSVLSYLPQSLMSLDRFAPWRRPELAILHFERARLAIMANQGELATRELEQAVALDPWRADLARAKRKLALELGHNSP